MYIYATYKNLYFMLHISLYIIVDYLYVLKGKGLEVYQLAFAV